jgi:hypothetical protein
MSPACLKCQKRKKTLYETKYNLVTELIWTMKNT